MQCKYRSGKIYVGWRNRELVANVILRMIPEYSGVVVYHKELDYISNVEDANTGEILYTEDKVPNELVSLIKENVSFAEYE